MAQIPDDRSETAFADYKPPYGPAQAVAEAERCLFCYDPPCVQACPTQIDIPTFIRKIATGNVRGSARTIFASNILGMSCARVCPVEVLCEGACVFNHQQSPPIAIGRLQRFATDAAFEEGWRFFEAGPSTGKRVACIGAGPASLAAAHELRRLGHGVTLFERRSFLGGLNTTGVAPYKMRADRALEEVERVLGIGGIELRLGVSIPEDLTWAELEESYDALFIGFGLGPDRIVGEEPMPPGAVGAIDWIEQLKLGKVDLDGVERLVVLGGGNTAIDVAREAAGLGVPEVWMVYRGTEEGMSGYAHEWAAAKVEGVHGVWRTQPVGWVTGEDGRLQGVRCVRLDERKQPVPDSEHVIRADRVVVAIGQTKQGELLAGLEGVELDGGRIVTDAQGATGRPGVFAGGDCRNGGKEVVNAVAEGRDAARAIHAYLTGGN